MKYVAKYGVWILVLELLDSLAKIIIHTYIKQRSKQERMHEIRWLTWEPFGYEDCVKCKMLPICMGRCAYRAMFVNKDRPDCSEWKYCLEHYIRARFNREKELKVAGEKPQ